MKHILLASALASGLLSQVAAQAPKLLSGTSPTQGFVALFEDEGTVWGLGQDYRARFDPAGFEFHPLLGKNEPVTRHLRFRLASAGRNSEVRAVADPIAGQVGELRYEFTRGDLREIYDVRSDGLKQSFVFGSKPAGSGDLVVRGNIDTNLTLGSANPTGIRLDGSNGSVTIGKVVGWDATGKQVEGTLNLDGSVLEMRLPSSFVDTAVAPITVDPLLGTSNTISSGDEYRPDVSYDATDDNWLVVWYREVSSTDVDIRGQRMASDGTTQGNGIGIRTSSAASFVPRVANNNRRNMFVVAWQEDSGSGAINRNIYARTVNAANGTLGTVKTIANEGADEYAVDVGGNSGSGTTLSESRVTMAWSRASSPAAEMRAAGVTVNSDGTLTIAHTRMLGFGGYDTQNVTISDASDATQTWWFVWDSYHIDWANNTYSSSGPRDIYGSYTDSLLNSLTGTTVPIVDGYDDANTQGGLLWYGAGGGILSNPSIAGSGNEWFIAYEARPASSSSEFQVLGAAIEYAPRHSTIDFPYNWRTIANRAGDQYRPEVAWGAESIIVSYMDNEGTSSNNPWIWEGDMDAQLGSSETQVSGADDCDFVAIATKTNGGNNVSDGEVSLIAFDRDAGATESVRTKRFRSDDGIVENLGGSCGSGDSTRAYAWCAMVGNSNHDLRIMNARGNENATLLIGFDEISSSCGTCTLHVNPFTAWGFNKSTTALGYASHNLPIPNSPALSGLSYTYQWLLNNSNSPSCAVFGVDFTDAYRVTIQ